MASDQRLMTSGAKSIIKEKFKGNQNLKSKGIKHFMTELISNKLARAFLQNKIIAQFLTNTKILRKLIILDVCESKINKPMSWI